MGGLIGKFCTRKFWRPITQSLFLMASGAWLLISYIDVHMPSTGLLGDLHNDIQLGWCILFMAWCATAPGNKESYRDLSPARSGTTVVAICGIAAAVFLSWDANWPEGLVVPGLILLGTPVVATFVYRFASSRALEIGEARFNTMAPSQHQDRR